MILFSMMEEFVTPGEVVMFVAISDNVISLSSSSSKRGAKFIVHMSANKTPISRS